MASIVSKLAKLLRKDRHFCDVVPITSAKVPIVKLRHRLTSKNDAIQFTPAPPLTAERSIIFFKIWSRTFRCTINWVDAILNCWPPTQQSTRESGYYVDYSHTIDLKRFLMNVDVGLIDPWLHGQTAGETVSDRRRVAGIALVVCLHPLGSPLSAASQSARHSRLARGIRLRISCQHGRRGEKNL